MTTPFAEWHAEIAKELGEAQQALAAAADALKEAEAAHEAAQAWHTAIRQAVAAALHGDRFHMPLLTASAAPTRLITTRRPQ